MFCRNCGSQLPVSASEVCPSCGTIKGNGSKFCPNCGAPTASMDTRCNNCGSMLLSPSAHSFSSPLKSKMMAGLLGLFLGWLGVHNFYLGYYGKAITQLVCALVGMLFLCCAWVFGFGTAGITFGLTFGISLIASFLPLLLIVGIFIWAVVESILIFAGKINTDGQGRPLAG